METERRKITARAWRSLGGTLHESGTIYYSNDGSVDDCLTHRNKLD